jgi:circadian clock protein KaiC
MGNGKPAGEAERSGPEQLPTGVPGLDRLLAGGLRRGGLHVVLGGPGAGKSVLAHQIGAHQIRAGGSVLYLTALVESHQMLLSQARTFSFFDPSFVPGSFYYASLYPSLAGGGLQGAREEIGRLVAHHAPTLLVIDGVHALKAAAESRLDYQRFMHDMEAQAAVAGTTTLMLVHPPESGIATDPTFTIADAIVHMHSRMVRLRDVRLFSVGKLRGVAHVGGWHTFRITGDGVHVYPRVEALASAMHTHMDGVSGSPAAGSDGLLDVRIKGLDAMLGGGLDRGSVTLVVGTPGGGKTLFGLAFLAAGVEAGEPGLMLGYHERPETLADKGDGVGLPIRSGIDGGMIHFDWRPPAELLADEEIERLLDLIEKHRIKRVVVDALEDIRQAVIPRSRELVVLASLANLLREKEVTTVVMHDLQRIVGVSFDMPMAELSALMDNVLHLRAVEQKGEMSRLIAVLKVRARMHDHALREFHITSKGMSVGKPFSGSEMVLTGLGLPR